MSPVGISATVFVSVFGGALAGVGLRSILPPHQLNRESKEVVKLSMGLVATMTALVLGLLVASAKESYDTQGRELTDLSSRIVMLDRVLAHYGPETQSARPVQERGHLDVDASGGGRRVQCAGRPRAHREERTSSSGWCRRMSGSAPSRCAR